MINTDDASKLFVFFAEDLTLSGFDLETHRDDLRPLLAQVKPPATEKCRNTVHLDFSLDEFDSTLGELGTNAQFMWPGSTVKSAGLRLLLTHFDEQLATRWSGDDGPGHISLAHGEIEIVPAELRE